MAERPQGANRDYAGGHLLQINLPTYRTIHVLRSPTGHSQGRGGIANYGDKAMMIHQARLKSWFLGPHAENQDAFEKLLLEAFRDYCHWRKNFHPEDPSVISAKDRLSPDFVKYYESLRDRLFEMLAQLKRSVPFFSPRYLGHMNSDLLISGLLGYFAAMLYNQNNIVREAATITQQFENEAIKLVADMLGLPDTSWGHLCSGGTAANIEALWVARNIRLLPYQIALVLKDPSLVQTAHAALCDIAFGTRRFGELFKAGELHTLTVDQLVVLRAKVGEICSENPEVAMCVEERSPGKLGLAEFSRACQGSLGAAFPTAFKVLMSRNAHYSLRKCLGILGLGEGQALNIDLDNNLRMDMGHLKRVVSACHEQNQCILAVVGVYGSTEEGCIDDFGHIQKIKHECHKKGAGDFWVHGDACYGGYALSMARPSASVHAFLSQLALDNLGQATVAWDERTAADWLRRSEALAQCDSVSIDPHKLGYIPYPAGAVFYRDFRVRECIRCDAPYLNASVGDASTSDAWNTPYLGTYTLEGSRPGAYSGAIWLAHKTVPLDRTGHGITIALTILGARFLQATLHKAMPLGRRNGVGCGFLCDRPDLNILCYTLPATVNGERVPLAILNRAIEALYNQLLPTEEHATHTREFVVSMTSLGYAEYGQLLNALHTKFRIGGRILSKGDLKIKGNPWRDDSKLTVLRTVVMSPFLTEAKTRARMAVNVQALGTRYAEFLRATAQDVISAAMNEPLPDKLCPVLPGKLLVLEDDDLMRQHLRSQVHRSFHETQKRVFSADTLREALKFLPEVNAALVDLLLMGKFEGLDFLRRAATQPSFRGAVVFTSQDKKCAGSLEQLRRDFPKLKLFICRKPPVSDQYTQHMVNRVMADLWEVMNRGK